MFPDPLKKDDIETVFNLLKEVMTNGNRSFDKKFFAASNLKNRNFIYIDWLGQFFEYYEAKLKAEEANSFPLPVHNQESTEKEPE
jgi:hypothetical protein